jgi:hypothetical protein
MRDVARASPIMMMQILLSLLLVVALAGCRGLDAPSADVHGAALDTVADMVFQPPIGVAPVLTGNFDDAVSVAIELYLVSKGKPDKQPLGPSFATSDGTIGVTNDPWVREEYEARWNTRYSNVPDGTLIRLEVRSGTLRSTSPACGGGASIKRGCLAYLDVRLVGSRGTSVAPEPGILHVVNGRLLPIRFHIRRGPLELDEIVVGVDLHPPTLEIAAPPSETTVVLGEPVELRGAARDSSAAVLVEVYVDHVRVAAVPARKSALAPDAFDWFATWEPMTTGSVTLTVHAYDANGNMSSAALRLEVVEP